MNANRILIDLLILSVGIFTALMAFYYFAKQDIQRFLNIGIGSAKKASNALLLPLRLQAHERLIIFVERINPINLLLRLHQPGISINELQGLVLNDIKSEFQHNITQQLYLSSISWDIIRKLKDDTVSMINNAVQGLPENASGVDLSKKVLQHLSTISKNPFDLTIEHLKKDIQELF